MMVSVDDASVSKIVKGFGLCVFANEVITNPVARPRRSKGITSPITVCVMADKMPPNVPAATRAAINKP